MDKPLAIYVGSSAAKRLREQGWHPDLFSLLLGASGGPKMFVLSQLDRVLFPFLLQRREPLAAVGSSIGAWRHVCLAQQDPVAAMNRLEHGYLHQQYEQRPTAAQISHYNLNLLDEVLGAQGANNIIEHDIVTSHIVTARGRGLASVTRTAPLAMGMAAAAVGNSVHRKLLEHSFQRVVFHSGEQASPALPLAGFATKYVSLSQNNIRQALHATASIPFLLTGDCNISGGPRGQYWDGGIIDYHFDPAHGAEDGLVLYPHFSGQLIGGWFDKFLPWRRNTGTPLDNVIVLCPSEAFIHSLPGSKIPDRRDFTKLGTDERIKRWKTVVTQCQTLAEAFERQREKADPLDGVHVLPAGARRLGKS